MAPLNALQRRLEQLYEVHVDYRVADFVITDAELARRLEGDPAARPALEKLLVHQHEDGLDLALYLDAALVERLSEADPRDGLHGGNLADYCTALEGVSHFLYLSWNAGHDRAVTQMELEMQAEVDKYVTSAWALRDHTHSLPAQLHRWLFEQADFADDLSRTELERYRDASRYAGAYCRHLADRFLDPHRALSTGMLNELRRFYRLPLHHKIRRIERMH